MTFHKNINSGPPDKQVLVFRYQYLLIEVGTVLLRKLYDDKKSSYNNFNKDLTGLLKTNILNNDQKKLLQIQNTANYDITLLTCLLQSTCGLKLPEDPVWKNPAKTDLRVEAEITRLRECRNYVAHKGTNKISESEFNQKWFELCQILYRLNHYCRVSSLTEMVMDAKSKPLDNILKSWKEAESVLTNEIEHIKIHQLEIQDEVSKLKDDINDIKELLIQSYEKHFRVTPLCSEDYGMDMLTVNSHRTRQSEGNILPENIVLREVQCKEHDSSKHFKLLLLDYDTNIECRINNSCCTSLRLKGCSCSGRCPGLTNVVIQNSKLKCLNLDTDCIHHTEINHVIDSISSLKYIKSVELYNFTIDSVPLQIHPDIVCDEYIYIELNHVTMSDKSFQDFIHYVVHHQSVVRVCIEDFNASPSNSNSWNDRCQKLKANRFVRMLYECDDSDFIYDNEYDDDGFCIYSVLKLKFEFVTIKS